MNHTLFTIPGSNWFYALVIGPFLVLLVTLAVAYPYLRRRGPRAFGAVCGLAMALSGLGQAWFWSTLPAGRAGESYGTTGAVVTLVLLPFAVWGAYAGSVGWATVAANRPPAVPTSELTAEQRVLRRRYNLAGIIVGLLVLIILFWVLLDAVHVAQGL